MFPTLPITPFSILTAIGFVLASFLFWRSLKDDFPEEEILTLTIWLAASGLLVSRLVWALEHARFLTQSPLALIYWTKFPGFSLLGGFLGLWGTLGYWTKKKEWDFWQVLDHLLVVCLVLFVFGTIGTFLTNQEIYFAEGESNSVYYLLLGAVGSFGILIKKFWLTKYRSFAFYPSGKVGFVGLALTIVFFGLILPLDFYHKGVLSWEALGFLVIIFVSLGLLYRRSERKVREDFKGLKRGLRLRSVSSGEDEQ